VNVLRRAWRVLVAPPQSQLAWYFIILIAIWSADIAVRAVAGWEWPPRWDRVVHVAWAYAVLWIVRERDEARAEVKARDVAHH
jgi:hypothetical protein